MKPEFAKLFLQVAANMTAVAESPYIASIEQAVDLIHDAFASGHKLLVFGNGGSSADAQHLTAEFVGRFVAERRPLPAIALTTNQAILTAWSNDYSFDDVFARQVEALGVAGDVAFGISTSGRSPNVVNALRRARESTRLTLDALRSSATLEFVALDLHLAVKAVGEIVGKTTTEDLLDSIFRQFCLGK